MNRIVTALSVSALLGATAIGSLQAGGPPTDGYDTQTRSETRTPSDTMRDSRSPGAAPTTVDRSEEPVAGTTGERSAASRESMSGAEAQNMQRDTDGRPDTLFGYPVSYTYPYADDDEVQPERIGGVTDPATSGWTVGEITGRSRSVAELHEVPSEDSFE